jgi:hypothetical protein
MGSIGDYSLIVPLLHLDRKALDTGGSKILFVQYAPTEEERMNRAFNNIALLFPSPPHPRLHPPAHLRPVGNAQTAELRPAMP